MLYASQPPNMDTGWSKSRALTSLPLYAGQHEGSANGNVALSENHAQPERPQPLQRLKELVIFFFCIARQPFWQFGRVLELLDPFCCACSMCLGVSVTAWKGRNMDHASRFTTRCLVQVTTSEHLDAKRVLLVIPSDSRQFLEVRALLLERLGQQREALQ